MDYRTDKKFNPFLILLSTISIILIYNASIVAFNDVKGANSKNNSSNITFEINPNNSGDVYCNGQKVSGMSKIYSNDTEIDCKAKSKNGFIFNSWAVFRQLLI